MVCDAVDQHKIDVLVGSSDLGLHMGKVCFIIPTFKIKRHLYSVFALIPQLGSGITDMRKSIDGLCTFI